tara:strand:- start:1242 stop:3380 length:2139 start_codon:yes stop_codon:yes gene_type:complete
MSNIKFSDYSIDNLKSFLEKKLFLKLNKIGVKTIGDFEKLTLNEFSSHKGIGSNAIKLFLDFKTYFKNNKISLFDKIKEENELKILPISKFKSDELNFLEELSKTVINFCDNTLKVKYSKIFLAYYGLGTDKSSNADIALINNISNERVRQIRIKILKQFIQFVNQGIDLKNKIKLREDIANNLNKIKLEFNGIECFVFKEFKKYISTEFKINSIDNFSNELEFLIDFLNYSFLGKLESQYTKAVIVTTNLKSKKIYSKIIEHTLILLKKECIKISENDLIINLKKKIGKFENQNIIRFIKTLPEIDCIKVNGNYLYEIKFHLLSRASDKAYRILHENKKEMYIDDIVSKINSLQIEHKSKLYDRHSLTLHSDKRFKSFGKTGKWILSSSNTPTETIETLIKKALIRLDKPSTLEEIISKVNEERKNVNIKSIQILLSKICHKTDNKLYILKEWKNKYKDLKLLEKRKKYIRKNQPIHRLNQIKDVTVYLENKNQNKDYASSIIKSLSSKDSKYTTQSFYKIFENKKYFEKIFEGKSLIIKLKKSFNKPVEQNSFEIIKSGESNTCEFKETMRVCLKQKAPPEAIELGVLKTIAAFSNSNGGDLFIGVNDSEEIVGLEKDYLSFKPIDQNKDGFQKHLDNIISKTFTNSIFSSLLITIETINNLDFCRINVKKARNTIFAKINKDEKFYIRRSGSTVELSKSEMIKYLKNRS